MMHDTKPNAEHLQVFHGLTAANLKALLFLVHVEDTSAGTDRRYTKSVKPAPLGRHLMGIELTTHKGNIVAAKEGVVHLRVLAAQRCAYEPSEREGWRLTPFGRMVAQCAQQAVA